MLAKYSARYDARNQARERIYKLSRDVTKKSKEIIFFMHRIRSVEGAPRSEALLTARHMIDAVVDLILSIRGEIHSHSLADLSSASSATSNSNSNSNNNGSHYDREYWRFQRTFSFGLQEFVEAVSFYTYLQDRSLVSQQRIDAMIRDRYTTLLQQQQSTQSAGVRVLARSVVPCFALPLHDYLLGILDLGGELMRYSLNMLSAGAIEVPQQVCDFLRQLFSALDQMTDKARALFREWDKKMKVLLQCVQKVEVNCYNLCLRHTESETFGVADESNEMLARLVLASSSIEK